MSAAATPTPTSTERRLALLEELAELGLSLVRTLEHDVAAAHAVQDEVARHDPTCRIFPPFDFADASLCYARIARAVRLTLALHARLEAGAYRPFPVAEAGQGAGPNGVARSAAAPAAGGAGEGEAHERLSDRDDLDALLEQPAGALIAQVCRDLGLSPDRAAATQAGWAEAADDLEDADDEASPPAVPLGALPGLGGFGSRKTGRARGP